MEAVLEEKPFKNREDVKAEVKRCSMVCSIIQYLSFLFAILGIICGVLDPLSSWTQPTGFCWQFLLV